MNFSDIDKASLLITSLPFRRKKAKWIPEFTRYWLRKETPLGIAISQLESEGWIKSLEERIAAHPPYVNWVRTLHSREIEIRIALFHQHASILPPSIRQRFHALIANPSIGLGGIRGWTHHSHIKCLHLWVAYALGDPEHFENPVATWVFELLQERKLTLSFP